jgi:MoaA/NifB/PqqE/SkfB family radical SAM enzyme
MTPDLEFADGFYAEEFDGFFSYRWMQVCGRFRFVAAAQPRYLELIAFSEFKDFSQELIGRAAGARRVALAEGWSPISFAIPAGATEFVLEVNKPFPREYYASGDDRELAIRVRAARLHDSEHRHLSTIQQGANLARNIREMLAGRTELETTPPRVGIDLYGACNVKPPCVYCEWDSSKAAEGDDVDTPFTLDTLREWGPLFDNTTTLINCSIGEPFMMRNLDELLDAFAEGARTLEITTNGQIMTDRIIQRLVGRPIKLHVSLDAGTPETYAKLRNNRFEPIVRNLERLIAAKGGPGHYPHVHLVFMPMRLNVHELPLFVDLAARLRVDLAVLRPLNYAFESNLNWDRAGYRFEYVKELLPLDELARVSGQASALCARAGVALADQMDFGGLMSTHFEALFDEGRQSVGPLAPLPAALEQISVSDQPEATPAAVATAAAQPLPSLGDIAKPACTEPWDSLFILRRGVLPCCYGAKPIAKMADYREAWNSPLLQDIRRELAAGRLHSYCRESPSCPIVRKEFHDAPPPAPPEPDAPAPPPPLSLLRRARGRFARTWHELSGR